MQWQPGWTLAQVEKAVIYEALKFYHNNKVHTARALGISERTLYNKLELYEGRVANANGEGVELGVCVEPVEKLSAQQPVPLRERHEVQEMPSRQTSGSYNGNGSRKVKSAR